MDFCPNSPREKYPASPTPEGNEDKVTTVYSLKWLLSRARGQRWAVGKPQLPAVSLFSAPFRLSLVAVDRQDTGPEGGAADGRRRDRLEVGVEGAVREDEAKERDGGINQGSTSLGSQKLLGRKGRDCDDGSSGAKDGARGGECVAFLLAVSC